MEGPVDPRAVAPHSREFGGGGGGGGGGEACGGTGEGYDDYATPAGTSAVVKHFLDAADEVHYGTRLTSLMPAPAVGRRQA